MMQAGLHYVAADDIGTALAESGEALLGYLGFGEPDPDHRVGNVPFAWVDLPTVGAGRMFELWASQSPVRTELPGRIRIARNDQVLFGCLQFDEGTRADYDALTYSNYCLIFDCIDDLGYPNLIRTWHYVPEIHLDSAAWNATSASRLDVTKPLSPKAAPSVATRRRQAPLESVRATPSSAFSPPADSERRSKIRAKSAPIPTPLNTDPGDLRFPARCSPPGTTRHSSTCRAPPASSGT
jgi:hypothetical protein